MPANRFNPGCSAQRNHSDRPIRSHCAHGSPPASLPPTAVPRQVLNKVRSPMKHRSTTQENPVHPMPLPTIWRNLSRSVHGGRDVLPDHPTGNWDRACMVRLLQILGGRCAGTSASDNRLQHRDGEHCVMTAEICAVQIPPPQVPEGRSWVGLKTPGQYKPESPGRRTHTIAHEAYWLPR